MRWVEPRDAAPVVPMPRPAAFGWIGLAVVAAVVVPVVLDASLPLLTFVLLVIAAVVLRRAGTAAALGLVRVPAREFARVTASATVAVTALFGVGELVFHPYRELLVLVRAESTPDSTFAWVIHHGRGWGVLGFVIYGALVTMFAEEVVFRGALVHRLRCRGVVATVAVSTGAFAAIQTIPALLLPTGAAVGFLAVDAIAAVGVVGGLAAYRTRSIWPGLIAITVANAVVLVAVA